MPSPTHDTPGAWLSGVRTSRGSATIRTAASRRIRSRRSTSAKDARYRRSRFRRGGRRRRRLRPQLRLQLRRDDHVSQPSTPLPMEFNPRKLSAWSRRHAERELLAARYAAAALLDVVRRPGRERRWRTSSARQSGPPHAREPRERARDRRRVQEGVENDLSHIALPTTPVGVPSSFDEQMIDVRHGQRGKRTSRGSRRS